MKTFFSIIIPFGKESAYIDECVKHCLRQSFKSFEILVLPDNAWKPGIASKKLRIFQTGKIGPAEKRDIGAKKAVGEFLAFIDDDVFPEKEWLENSVKILSEKKVFAVCGPAVLVSKRSFMQKASALFYASRFGSEPITFRYVPMRERLVDDYPSSNLIIEKRLFLNLGGFDSKYYPGEDTLLCQKIIESGNKIFYSPRIVVKHFARSSLGKHLSQIFQYGLHRGFFVKTFLKNSLKLYYFLPLAFLIFWFLLFIFFIFSPTLFSALLLLTAILAYYFLIFVTVKAGFFLRLFAPFLFFMTHISYGFGFLTGLLKTRLER